MKKNKKEKFVDDGRTIYNMDVDGLPNRRNKNKIYVTKEEKKLIIKTALKHYIPIFIWSNCMFLFSNVTYKIMAWII